MWAFVVLRHIQVYHVADSIENLDARGAVKELAETTAESIGDSIEELA
jgi:hypothetical protein